MPAEPAASTRRGWSANQEQAQKEGGIHMRTGRYNEMMQGLIQTAIEKQCVFGSEDAKEHVERIGGMIEDLQEFWNSDGSLTCADWVGKLKEEMMKFEGEERKPILLCREHGHIYPITEIKEINTTRLSIRSRYNPELEYYLLRIPEGANVKPEAVIQNIIDYPEFLEDSTWVEKL